MGRAGLEFEPRLLKPGCCSQLPFVRLGKVFGVSVPQFLLLKEELNISKIHKHENHYRVALYTAGHRY